MTVSRNNNNNDDDDSIIFQGGGGGNDRDDSRITVMMFAKSSGLSVWEVFDIVRLAKIEPSRDTVTKEFVYDINDLISAVTSFSDDVKRRSYEHDARVIERIIPAIENRIGKIVEDKLTSVSAIRDVVQSRLFEMLEANRIQLSMIKKTSIYTANILAQLDLATTLGISSAASTKPGTHKMPQASKESHPIDVTGSPSPVASLCIDDNMSNGSRDILEETQLTNSPDSLTTLSLADLDFISLLFSDLTKVQPNIVSDIHANLAIIKEHFFQDRAGLLAFPENYREVLKNIAKHWAKPLSTRPPFKSLGLSAYQLISWVKGGGKDVPTGIIFIDIETSTPGILTGDDFAAIISL